MTTELLALRGQVLQRIAELGDQVAPADPALAAILAALAASFLAEDYGVGDLPVAQHLDASCVRPPEAG